MTISGTRGQRAPSRRRRRSFAGILCAVAVACAGLPASASARAWAPSAGAADAAALQAYHDYLSALVSGARASSARDSAVTAGVRANCPRGLVDLNRLSGSQLDPSALAAFGQEIDADLALAYMSATLPAFDGFAGALDALVWPTASARQTTRRLLSAERTVLSLRHANLCADATALDSAPLGEPTTTSRFLAGYRAAARSQTTALRAFVSLLSAHESASQRTLVAQIDVLVNRFEAESSGTQRAAAARVLSELGDTR